MDGMYIGAVNSYTINHFGRGGGALVQFKADVFVLAITSGAFDRLSPIKARPWTTLPRSSGFPRV